MHIPSMVERVIIHVEDTKSRLCVCSIKVALPRNRRLVSSVEIDPDETSLVNVHVDLEQAICVLVESLHLFEARGLGQFSTQPI